MDWKLAMCLTFTVLSLVRADAQQTHRYDRHNIAEILGFEGCGSDGALPAGWTGSPGMVATVRDGVRSRSCAAQLDRSALPSGSFSTVTSHLPIDFTGEKVELRGFLRTRDVSGFAGLWMREDGDGGTLQFDNMQRQQIAGTRNWQEFSIVLPLDKDAGQLFFGALLSGSGTAWVDGLQLLVDGKPIAQATQRVQEAAETDHAYDEGSGIAFSSLSRLQIENLALLGRVWGFLKYHDPVVTAGKRRWDYDLFRVLPSVLAATSRSAARAAIGSWMDGLGPVQSCTDCVSLSKEKLRLGPEVEWIKDAGALGEPLSLRLQNIYRNRIRNQQHYVSLAPFVQNPVFQHEPAYGQMHLPDVGYQLLALYRLWNIVAYWAPDRDVVGENWNDVLIAFIPRIALAKDRDGYAREMLALIALIHDTHANLWSSLAVRPPLGECRVPVDIRFIGKAAVVTHAAAAGMEKESLLEVGDEIVKLDDIGVDQLIADWAPFYADSNEAARLRDMAANLTNGVCGPVRLEVRRDGKRMLVTGTRVDRSKAGTASSTHDLPGPTFRMLSKDIAYLKLSSVKAADVPGYIEQARGTRGLIVDIRNYPSEFVVFALGSLLVQQPTPFAKFSRADLSNPGAFHMGGEETLMPSGPHYDGKVVVLVDESSISQAEYTAMALQATPHAVVVGSTTAGADGNVSRIPLPGGLTTMISGLGVFYPNGTPAQRVGVRIDVEALPTIAGIMAGRDEVLEKGMKQIVPELSAAELDELVRRGVR